MITRRSLIGTGLAATAVGTTIGATSIAGLAEARDVPSLAAVARPKRIDIGAIFAPRQGAEMAALVRRHTTVIVPENALKPSRIAPARDVRQMAPAKAVYDFARANGLGFHGHTLFWHKRPLGWAMSDDPEQVKRDYGGYIREMIAAFPETVSWDVFNEIFAEKRRLRDDPFLNAHGIDLIAHCLQVAKSANPAATLVINDYNLECAGTWCGQKRANALSVVGELIARGAPVDAIGIQGHLSSKYRPSGRKTLDFIRKLEHLGLDAHISELDVNDVALSLDVARRDQEIARYYGDFLGQVLKSGAVRRVTFWGLSDASHWIVKGYGGDTITGGTPRPAIFDADFAPKPAFDAVYRALEAAPARQAPLTATQAQAILSRGGYDPGRVDGAWGARSQAALNRFLDGRGQATRPTPDDAALRLLRRHRAAP